ncbi:sensor domain-containing protein [Mumia sp. DW29H23]|uniref:sensor histidine kinase n=1 Tax=Mumia sp. DW29H23 TaxID=3421241 RepID=UPI003D692ED7
MTREREPGPASRVIVRVRRAVTSTGYALYGAGIGLVALFTIPALLLIGVLWFLRVGQPLVRPTRQSVRWVADLERRRLRRLGHDVVDPHVLGAGAEDDAVTRRELGWLVVHGTLGLILGAAVLQLVLITVHDLTYPLWWEHVGAGEQLLLNGTLPARNDEQALLGPVIGVIAFGLWFVAAPALLAWQCRPGLQLLGPRPGADLTRRVAELTATRAAALDAHAVELRRIERALHDGSQNRIVGLAVLIGAARRELGRDPSRADEILARAQDTAEDALSELRAVVRTILPPVLENRGLQGALSALAADCPVPCTVTLDVPVRCPASVEATAYFVVAESLTNVARHSHARHAEVEVRLIGDRLHVRVADDGSGGADPDAGSGLSGIIGRVEAHDGRAALSSPPGGPTEMRVELPCGS